MSELEAQCVKMVRYAQQNIEQTVQSFDTRILDTLIGHFSKLEPCFLTTSNNLNQALIDADQMNIKLKQMLSIIPKS